jgi:hypothetical protein
MPVVKLAPLQAKQQPQGEEPGGEECHHSPRSEEEREATLAYVLRDMPRELFVELMSELRLT